MFVRDNFLQNLTATVIPRFTILQFSVSIIKCSETFSTVKCVFTSCEIKEKWFSTSWVKIKLQKNDYYISENENNRKSWQKGKSISHIEQPMHWKGNISWHTCKEGHQSSNHQKDRDHWYICNSEIFCWVIKTVETCYMQCTTCAFRGSATRNHMFDE